MKKLIDLSQSIYTGMRVYLGDPDVKVKIVHTIDKQTWLLRELTLGSHTGTHVDAFSHMDRFGKSLDEMPLKSFCGKAKVATAKDREDFPKNIGLIFSKGNKLSLELLEKLLKAKPLFVAVESRVGWEVELERRLLQNGVITYTGLVNCHLLPRNREFMFYGFPLKIKNGDGSPVRAVAILD